MRGGGTGGVGHHAQFGGAGNMIGLSSLSSNNWGTGGGSDSNVGAPETVVVAALAALLDVKGCNAAPITVPGARGSVDLSDAAKQAFSAMWSECSREVVGEGGKGVLGLDVTAIRAIMDLCGVNTGTSGGVGVHQYQINAILNKFGSGALLGLEGFLEYHKDTTGQ